MNFPKECFMENPIAETVIPMELLHSADVRERGRIMNRVLECGKDRGTLLLGFSVSAPGATEISGTVTLSVDGEKLVVDEPIKDCMEPGKTLNKKPSGMSCLFWAVDADRNTIGPFLPSNSLVTVISNCDRENVEITLRTAEYRLTSGKSVCAPAPETKYAVFRNPGHVLVGIEKDGFSVITLGEEYGEGDFEVMKFLGSRHEATYRQVVDRRVGEAKKTKPVPAGNLPGPVKDQGILRNL